MKAPGFSMPDGRISTAIDRLHKINVVSLHAYLIIENGFGKIYLIREISYSKRVSCLKKQI